MCVCVCVCVCACALLRTRVPVRACTYRSCLLCEHLWHVCVCLHLPNFLSMYEWNLRRIEDLTWCACTYHTQGRTHRKHAVRLRMRVRGQRSCTYHHSFRVNVLHVTVKAQVVYVYTEPFMWIGNYKITVKSALSRERGHRRQIRELKIKKN